MRCINLDTYDIMYKELVLTNDVDYSLNLYEKLEGVAYV
ncbi:hypothetical protein SAMN05421734_106126 [Pelagirhabdus alkalitolerans]|uniref:Uncharacterized protein n=1 Tax=Pelagirhabdus alkalitolerans TaxID=1612202 RepID=A0A1G6KL09_9BACI|nr:hypothetical protein SAMN05421734_106126 [Pelagirhabdus alkalitolerans]